MLVYTYSEARQNFARLLEHAASGTKVQIKRRDGKIFTLKIDKQLKKRSPLDVAGCDAGLNVDEIVSMIHESRKYG